MKKYFATMLGLITLALGTASATAETIGVRLFDKTDDPITICVALFLIVTGAAFTAYGVKK